jgi:phosphopentomutase
VTACHDAIAAPSAGLGTGSAAGIAGIAGRIAPGSGFRFANLVAFSQLYGHRNDVPGFYTALRQLDDAVPAISSALPEDDLLFIAADHASDPTTQSTVGSRENVRLTVPR